MAPEEFARGSWIDERTTVYTMGRTAFVFLSSDARGAAAREAWRGTPALFDVASAACAPRPEDRFGSVREFAEAWFAAR